MDGFSCLGAEQTTSEKALSAIETLAPAGIAVAKNAMSKDGKPGDKKDDDKKVREEGTPLSTYALYGGGLAAVGGLVYYFFFRKKGRR